ncbi:hypothetical protein [Roseomonas indoligenes]|uniref:Uncharacterized protein n=1 Tax=Roseomonas indoligenes TaxID=2820811 RepID=A0A940MVR4_9PROT|nr:hypothetical protein [Pararoseomonas indoligenes]MBP0492891.1 hypothetical protein [Pararoseomonas indoligenes]
MSAEDDRLNLVNQFAPGTLGCHEALHTTSILHDLVERQLCEHHAVKLNPEWAATAQRAANELWTLYQAIGADHLQVDPQNADVLRSAGRKNSQSRPGTGG